MKILMALAIFLCSCPALAEITRVEYGQGLRVHPADGSPYEYRVLVSGREKFRVFLERWEWLPVGKASSTLTFKDRLLILEELPLEISYGPEDLLHEYVTLRSLQGSSAEGAIFLDLGDGRFGSETMEIKSPKLAPYFASAGPVKFKLSLGTTKQVHGTFAPALSEVEETKICWGWDEYRGEGCELSTVLTVWGNEVDHLTSLNGERIFGDLEQGGANQGRLKRQGFLRVNLRGHLKGRPVQLRDAAGRVLLETVF